MPYFDDKLGQIMSDWTSGAGGFLLGRRTYEIFAASWPHVTDPQDRIATTLNREPKYVASRTLDSVHWHNSSLIKGDVAAEVARLKEQDGGEIQVHGSGGLIQTLLEHNLVDAMRLWIFPVVLGSGKRLFGAGTVPAALRLTSTEFSTTGAVLHVYERVGEVEHGTFVLDDATRERWKSSS